MKIFSMIAFLFFALSHGAESGYSLIVNAQNPLDPSYVPPDLVCVRHARAGREELCLMQKTASEALDAMLDAAKDARFDGVSVTNGYRSYDYQKFLYYEYYPHKEKYPFHLEIPKYTPDAGLYIHRVFVVHSYIF